MAGLETLLTVRVMAINAAAGYGKTPAAAMLLKRLSRVSGGRLSLDAGDDDMLRFPTALRRNTPSICSKTRPPR